MSLKQQVKTVEAPVMMTGMYGDTIVASARE